MHGATIKIVQKGYICLANSYILIISDFINCYHFNDDKKFLWIQKLVEDKVIFNGVIFSLFLGVEKNRPYINPNKGNITL